MSDVELLNESCSLLPSIKEGCLSSEEQEEVDQALKVCFNSNYERMLVMCQYSNGEMYGSMNSLHSSSSLVHTTTPIPGFVQKNIIFTILNISGEKRTYKLYLALVHWLSVSTLVSLSC